MRHFSLNFTMDTEADVTVNQVLDPSVGGEKEDGGHAAILNSDKENGDEAVSVIAT